VDEGKAAKTIEELQLDGSRLRRLRKAGLDRVNDQMSDLMRKGLTVEEARTHLSKGLLTKDVQGRWPAFFSALRDYLGEAADAQLISIGYHG